MNFLERIFEVLKNHADTVVLQEPQAGNVQQATAAELLRRVAGARGFLRAAGLRKQDRVVLLAANGIDWAACNLAVMAEGLTHVPLYTRQDPRELVEMIEDSGAAVVLCGTPELRAALQATGATLPRTVLVQEVMAAPADVGPDEAPHPLAPADVVTIIYTSGTSGVSKGVMLTLANLDHMLPCTMQRLDELMGDFAGQESVFHYLPFCFAGSWILLLTSLTRGSHLTLGTDLDKLAEHMKLARPHYFLNVPILLDRTRQGVEEKMAARGGLVQRLFNAAVAAWGRRQQQQPRALDGLWLGLANSILFAKIRARISPQLRALICGSAPLAKETQLFFEMMRIPVLQVYGLTETTAICTMDKPSRPRKPGHVGLAIPGIEMKTGERNEILVRGPHVFAGYWGRPEDTTAAMQDGWFRTGDQGEVNVDGNWRIVGRVKNIIVLSSGHNVEPEALEARLKKLLPHAEQVVVVGHEKPHLTVVVTGAVLPKDVDRALQVLNETLPHYKRVRGHHLRAEPFSIDNGFLTANGKLKRQLVLQEHHDDIEALYAAATTRK